MALIRPAIILCAVMASMANAQTGATTLPSPWNQIHSLTATQIAAITVLIDSMHARQARIAVTSDSFVLAEYRGDSDRHHVSAVMAFRRETMQQGAWFMTAPLVERLLSPAQVSEERAAWYRLVDTLTAQGFSRIAAKQQAQRWCWAAVLQMVVNYAGIPVSQDDIVQDASGKTDDHATDVVQLAAALGGQHAGRPGRYEEWDGECTTLPVPVQTAGVIRLLDRGEIVPLALSEQHLVVLHRVTFRFDGAAYSFEQATIYDPLTGTDTTMAWRDLASRVSNWFACAARTKREHTF